VVAFRLKGVLFFGNCVNLKLELAGLFEKPNQDLDELKPSARPPKYVVLDFTEVVYVDSSVWEVLANISVRAQTATATEVFLCGLSSDLFKELGRQGEKRLSKFNLDCVKKSYLFTLEHMQENILEVSGGSNPRQDGWEQFVSFVAGGMSSEAASQGLMERIQRYFREQSYERDAMVQTQGDDPQKFCWVLSGEFHVFTKVPSTANDLRNRKPTFAPRRQSSLTSKQTALLYAKLPRGFIAGIEVICHEERAAAPGTACANAEVGGTTNAPMLAYTSLQCKYEGTLLELSREDFQRLRAEDPDLCVALLLAVTSQREVQLRRHMWYRVELDEVQLGKGFKRLFTDVSRSEQVRSQILEEKFDPLGSLHQKIKKLHSRLQEIAIRARISKRYEHVAPPGHVTHG